MQLEEQAKERCIAPSIAEVCQNHMGTIKEVRDVEEKGMQASWTAEAQPCCTLGSATAPL